MTGEYELLTDAFRCALHGRQVEWESVSAEELLSLMRLAREHGVLAMVAEAVYLCPAVKAHEGLLQRLVSEARSLTISQAQRTADFLLFYEYLRGRGLTPIVTKGVMCRTLYPNPDQRTSVDEDMLIGKGEFEAYHAALTDFGMETAEPGPPLPDAFEVSFIDREKNLYIEVHKTFFAPGSDAYGDCNKPLEGAADRSVWVTVDGVPMRTFAPTDHLIYLILHAYKHFLHAGVGIRQVGDICVFARHYAGRIDFPRVLRECEGLHVERFAAALFAIGKEKLDLEIGRDMGFPEVETGPLLFDILSGGLYGVNDINRAHSSTLTLEAAAAERLGRRRKGASASVFLPRKMLEGRFPYLRKHPWLLPLAWAQRAWGYLKKRRSGGVQPSESLRIGKERIELMKKYGLIDR